jgi:NAD(P)-dependent dehydrogenase (short-subunit alcohol dehydrogenase family)
MDLKGCAAVVTGGASGLGKATSDALARAGARVAIFDMNEQLGESVAGLLGAIFCNVDVTSDASVDAGFAKARAVHGQERILINCAGTGKSFKTASRSRDTGEIRHFPVESFENTVKVNLIGTFRCIAKSAAGMLTLEPMACGERGVIVNTASVAAEDGQPGQASYSASKGGIVSMTLTIARDLAGEGIRINTILPGIFATPPMLAVPDCVRNNLERSVPFPKRMGAPEEYASLALEMCRNVYLNGEDVRLDGAIRMGFSS